MAIIADIEDLAPAEFLLMLSLNRKSGKLTVVRGEHKALVAFRNGSIVYAASTAVRERIGTMLVNRKLVTEQDLLAALAQQEREPGVKHLGSILVEMGAITASDLEQVVRSQFQKVLAELLSWHQGVMTFARMEIPDLGAVHVSAREILLDMGFETEQLVLGSMSELEDSRRELAHRQAGRPAAGSLPLASQHAEPTDSSTIEEADTVVRTMMEEMRTLSVSLTAEATLAVLTRAAEVVDRAVLVLVFVDYFGGVGGFGVERDGESSELVVRQLVVPRDHESVFARVVREGCSYRGPLESTVANQHLVEHLGGAIPDEVVAVPMAVDGRVVAVLYGDTAPANHAIGPLDHLERAMADAGLSLETGSD